MIRPTSSFSFLALLLAAAAHGAGENLALHKPVTFYTTPNYSLSTDANDASQLTDGKISTGSPMIWAHKDSVTWQRKRCVFFTIDLGEVRNIGKVRFSTAARTPASGVRWPRELLVFLSDDGLNWSYATDIVESLRQRGRYPADDTGNVPVAKVLESDEIAAAARYVGIVGRGTPFLTSDEIEITSAAPATPGEAPIPVVTGKEGVERFFLGLVTNKGVMERIAADREALKERIARSALDEERKGELLGRLAKIPATRYDAEGCDPYTFRSVFPLNEEHRRVFEVQALLWRMQGAEKPKIAAPYRYDWLPHLHDLGVETGKAEIRMLGDERRSTMLAVSNPLPHPVTFTAEVKLPPELEAACSLRQAAWTDTQEQIAVADALLPLEGRAFTVPSGMTTKLWISLDGTGIKAGNYRGAIMLQGGGFSREVPLEVGISPVTLAREPFPLGMWDYLLPKGIYGFNARNRAAGLEFLRKNGVGIAWLPARALPMPKQGDFDKENRLLRPLDYSRLTGMLLKDWPDARYYFFFMNVRETFAGARMGTPEFRERVAAWMKDAQAGFEKGGIPPQKVALQPVDEPYNRAKALRAEAWLEAMDAAKSRMKIFTNPTWSDFETIPKDYIRYADIVSPNLQIFHQTEEATSYFRRVPEQGKEFWFYACSGPTRLADPSGYYRLASWYAYAHGATGLGFWALGDTGGATSSWNEYTAGFRSNSPVFVSDEGVDTSIHWEALMEGVLDYSCFHMLAAAAQEHPEYGERVAGLMKEAASHFSRIPGTKGGEGFTDHFWYDSPGAREMDSIRLKAITLLEEMRAGGEKRGER